MTSTSSNFEKIISCISLFDACISNQHLHDKDWKSKMDSSNHCGKVMKKLIADHLGLESYGIHQYIKSTFNCFCKNKTLLYYDLWTLETNVKDDKLLNTIIPTVEKDEENNIKMRSETDYTNLFDPKLMQIFPNLKRIRLVLEIHTISFLALLSLIKNTGVKKVEVNMDVKSYWKENSANIVQRYKDENFNVKFTQRMCDDEIIITRM